MRDVVDTRSWEEQVRLLALHVESEVLLWEAMHSDVTVLSSARKAAISTIENH